MKKVFLFAALGLILAAIAFASQGSWPVPGPHGTWTSSSSSSSSGGEDPASGAIILGSNSTTGYTSTMDVPLSYEMLWNQDAITASWSESASTTTVASLRIYLRGWFGGNCVAWLKNSNGTAVTNGVSNAVNFDYEESMSFKTFTFATPPTVTKNTGYIVGMICDSDWAVKIGALAAGDLDLCSDTSGSYASPPGDVTCTLTNDYAVGPFYAVH